MKVYVEAQSKAALIRRLAAGEEITGLNYSMFGGGGYYKLDNTLEDGTIIAIYSQMSNGNPVAKSWGTWTNGVLKAETFEARSGGKPLLKRQEKLLEQYRQTGGDAHYYDRLPVSLQEELKNIKFHETLHQAIDRWLSSNKPTGFSYSRWDAETFEAEPGWVSGPDAEPHPDLFDGMLLDEYQQVLDEWEGDENPPSLEEYFNEDYWKARDKYDREEEIAYNKYMEYLSTLTEEEAMEEMYGAETFEAPRTMTKSQAKKKFLSLALPYWIKELTELKKGFMDEKKDYEKENGKSEYYEQYDYDIEDVDTYLKMAKSGRLRACTDGDTVVREMIPDGFYYLINYERNDYDTWESTAYEFQGPKSIQKQLKALLPIIEGKVTPKPKTAKKTTTKPKAKTSAKKSKAKAKTGRKAPIISATKRKVGTRMRGNDGKMWQVKKSGKSQRWMAGAETFEGHHGYHAETLMCPICDSVCDHDSQNLYDCSSCEIMWVQDEDGGFDFLEAESIPAGVGVIFK